MPPMTDAEGPEMSLPSLIIDTCALHDREFKSWLRRYSGDKSIPSVVYMEMCRQYLEKGRPAEELDEWLKGLEIKILRFDKSNARMAAELMVGRESILCEKCRKIDWVDTVVASYYNMGDYIITNNKSDFPTSGGFEERILTTDEFMNRR
jgi:predicted nucleic acid-binding protein